MSEAKRFLDAATKNKDIATEINLAEEAKVARILAVAKENGYEFSAQELYKSLDLLSAEKSVSNDGRCYTMFTDCYAVLT